MQGHYTKGNKTYPCTVTKKDNVVYNVNKGKVRDADDNKMSTKKQQGNHLKFRKM